MGVGYAITVNEHTLGAWIPRLGRGEHLSAEAAAAVARELVPASVAVEQKRDFLAALARKGETATEVAAFAAVFRDLARAPDLGPRVAAAVDVCGTGGSHTGRFNVSTTVAFLVAALGVPVVKHGNRSVTSRSGSADFLEALGFPTQADDDALRRSLDEIGFCFLFAPSFHPAFKEIGPVRRELAASGQRTIFNLLGPLINPARPPVQVLGVFAARWVDPLASALDALGLRRGWVVHGSWEPGRGVDELTTVGANEVAGFGEWTGRREQWDAASRGWPFHAGQELAGGVPVENVALLNALAAGHGRAALAEAVALNAGAALWSAGAASDLEDGRARAHAALVDGTLARWLAKARKFHGAND